MAGHQRVRKDARFHLGNITGNGCHITKIDPLIFTSRSVPRAPTPFANDRCKNRTNNGHGRCQADPPPHARDCLLIVRHPFTTLGLVPVVEGEPIPLVAVKTEEILFAKDKGGIRGIHCHCYITIGIVRIIILWCNDKGSTSCVSCRAAIFSLTQIVKGK